MLSQSAQIELLSAVIHRSVVKIMRKTFIIEVAFFRRKIGVFEDYSQRGKILIKSFKKYILASNRV
jgi:predicted HAD superfamily hydrolase